MDNKVTESVIHLVYNAAIASIEGWSSVKQTAERWNTSVINVHQMVRRNLIKYPDYIVIGTQTFIRNELQKPTTQRGHKKGQKIGPYNRRKIMITE